ncbi:hypothetical protein OSB04_005779 [Centaurea solstitialis]|uniref:Glyoxal oxidase n=1 Tax=Centaurea solstitialis TaxID=347529 RepID=A0AA38TIF4_9ASTR|nr:hypothetical protein OSB04_005779 [Centaurea solstitialis]
MTFRFPLFYILLLLHHAPPCPATPASGGGSWSLLLPSIGISATHIQLLPTDRVFVYDRTYFGDNFGNFGNSNISLLNVECRPNTTDCTSHSVEYDVASNSFRPFFILTNFYCCSSGTLRPDGSLGITGGFKGGHFVRVSKPCDTCDWQEIPSYLAEQRWYSTNQILPDGRQLIVGGRTSFTYEFYPKASRTEDSIPLPFLKETTDPKMENNLYPFVFLNTDGNVFIYANDRAILFDYVKNKVVKTYPNITGGEPRNYPSTGSAVLLPMRIAQGKVEWVEVLICGGAPRNAYFNAKNGTFDKALDTCGRIKISDPDPQWVMETMPIARIMGDMVLLPNGCVLIINGAGSGVAGWELGRDPVLTPVIYHPDRPVGSRFEMQKPSTVPRMYDSTAALLRDGRVLVSGSNPHKKYEFSNVLFPTELTVEAFSPVYLDPSSVGLRPKIISPHNRFRVQHGQQMDIQFKVSNLVDPNLVLVTMVAPPFVTNSNSMNQRLLILEGNNKAIATEKLLYKATVTAPASRNVAPTGLEFDSSLRVSSLGLVSSKEYSLGAGVSSPTELIRGV